MADLNRRASSRSTKRKSETGGEKEDSPKKIRRCDKIGCSDIEPSCCLRTYDGCTISEYTSRWYHMSLGEHFCNNCFDNLYRPGRPGNELFNDWINEWSCAARVTKPTIKRYVANKLLAYWVRCTNSNCHKWRMLSNADILEPDYIRKFKCSMAADIKSCKTAEDKLVAFATDEYFIDQLAEAPLLKNSLAAPFLKRFLSEDVGICPLSCKKSAVEDIVDVQPFLIDQCGEASIWPKPDATDDDEKTFVANTLISPATYLGMRNLIVTLWNMSPKEWLDIDKVNPYIICRGLIRIHLWSLSCLILKLLTRKSVINYGILENPHLAISKTSESDVLIIGAGISGLAAAKHLQNLGVNVVIFESDAELGGRIKGNSFLSKAYFIQGILNNPFRILALQVNQEYQKLLGGSIIFDSKGNPVSKELEKNMQYKLRGIAQGALESTIQSKIDCNWQDTITENFNKFVKMTSQEINRQLFDHLLKLFQVELGADLRHLSLLNWEYSSCTKGDNVFFPEGITKLITKLAKNLNIVYGNKVKEIDYRDEKVKIKATAGEYSFSKVLITVPHPVLQKGEIVFQPTMPDFKQKAVESLGDYYCSKLVMQFPKKFWITNNQSPFQEFSVMWDDSPFALFLDLTVPKKNSSPTLVAFIPHQALEKLQNKKDKAILEMCVNCLRTTFGKKLVPSPTKWALTDSKLSNFNSYGSYLKVGAEDCVFDEMAKAVDEKLFFAGEATFRNMPGNITGAYLSGLREAAKISEYFELP